VRAIEAGTAFLLLFGGIWTLVGVIVTIAFTVAGGPAWDDLILNRRAVVVSATPVSVQPGNGQINGRPIFRIAYTFTDRQGRARSSETSTTDGPSIAAASARMPLTVEYDPEQPSRSRMQGQSASTFGLFVLLPLAVALVGGAVLLVGLQRTLQLRALYVRGIAAAATVTGVSTSMMRVNDRPVLHVDYVFDAAARSECFGGRTTMRDAPAVGDQLWILYDPNDPTRNVAAA